MLFLCSASSAGLSLSLASASELYLSKAARLLVTPTVSGLPNMWSLTAVDFITSLRSVSCCFNAPFVVRAYPPRFAPLGGPTPPPPPPPPPTSSPKRWRTLPAKPTFPPYMPAPLDQFPWLNGSCMEPKCFSVYRKRVLKLLLRVAKNNFLAELTLSISAGVGIIISLPIS